MGLKDPQAVTLAVGETGAYPSRAGDSGAKTNMAVTFQSVKYVTPAQIGTAIRPKGQYVVLHLAVKNIGHEDGGFHPSGAMTWADAMTAERDAATPQKRGRSGVDARYKPGQRLTGDVVLDVGYRGGEINFYDGLDVPSLKFTLPTENS